VVRMPARPQPSGWDVRRRVAAVVLAAALVLAPATIASAASLPGQAMYPFKLAIEQLRLASVQWSPSREAGERTRVADERLDEVQSLLELSMFNQLPGAIKALDKAVLAAQHAVAQAKLEGEPVPGVEARLDRVKITGTQVVLKVVTTAVKGSVGLSDETANAIRAAVNQSTAVQPPGQPTAAPSGAPPTPTPSTLGNPGGGPGPASTTASTSATTTPQAGDPPETSTTAAPTTTAPTTTTEPPPPPTTPPTDNTATPGSTGGGADQTGPFGQAPPEQPPETTLP
jgi:hypothetical protein